MSIADTFALVFLGCYLLVGLSIILVVCIMFYGLIRMKKDQAKFYETIFGPDESEDDQWKRPS